MHASPATMYETMRAGPAVFRAASPVATKIPAPITAPMPKAVNVTGPSARFNRLSLSMSANRTFSDFVANNCLRKDIDNSGGDHLNNATAGKKRVVKYVRPHATVK